MKTVTPEFVRELIDFAPSEELRRKGFGEVQLEGAVAAFNMLARNRIAYIADEVGMGKTYIALGVMGLLRYMNPEARIVVIAPRENIQRKWIKELSNFVRLNWRVVGNRVKALQGGPVWEPVLCGALRDFGRELSLNANRDFFLRMTSFSLALKKSESRRRYRAELRDLMPWADNPSLAARTFESFRDAYGRSFNAVIPEIDLVVVDEAHNLKHGFGPRVSTRNRILGLSFGHADGSAPQYPWYGKRARRVLFLSATPFEEDYGAIYRQFDVFGFGGAELRDAAGHDPVALRDLADPELGEAEKRAIVSRLMLRRVSGIRIGGQLYTKNMYRREWRSGGLENHDDPVKLERPEQRLVVALMQKKVAEVLQDERFMNSFQIGMLSSFESFLESLGRMKRRGQGPDPTEEEGAEDGSAFDGRVVDATEEERRGIDTDAIAQVVESFRARFGRSLPHPKLDATADALRDVFQTGEKVLVFVRRIATVDELAAKLDVAFDAWIRDRMRELLPHMAQELDDILARYERDRARRPEERLDEPPVDEREPEAGGLSEAREFLDDEDKGGAETFFAWFFRGDGPRGFLSGAAFQKNRLAGISSAYATVFEDDHVSWLLGRPPDVLDTMATVLGEPRADLVNKLRRRAYHYFRNRSTRQDGYPRLYVFEAYQAVTLGLLEVAGGRIGEEAGIVLGERYPEAAAGEEDPPPGFPGPEEALGIDTFITELVKRPALRERLWPDEDAGNFRERFRLREQRRELLSAMSRLGSAYIDLYGLAIAPLGSLSLRGQTEIERPDRKLALDYLDLLEKQIHSPGFHAFRELSSAAENFDLLLAVNFPEVPSLPLREIAGVYGATLQRQVPVGRMSGGVNKRLVRQFRMPGFPFVLITTDVLQEGEDLHTFCKRVVHYGITWTPSAMEQRTGRIDRIGGLVQRELDGADEEPDGDAWIQVYYPHLQDTVEVLQIRRVFSRMNRFLHLIHKSDRWEDDLDSRIDASREFLEGPIDIQSIRTPLESAFPVRAEWLRGESQPGEFRPPDVQPDLDHLERLWRELLFRLPIDEHREPQERCKSGTLDITGLAGRTKRPGARDLGTQRFKLELRSQASGDATLLRCVSVAGRINARDDGLVDRLYDLQQVLDLPKVCARPDAKTHSAEISIEGDILFHPDTAQIEEVEALVLRTAVAAAGIESGLADPEVELPRRPRRRPASATPVIDRLELLIRDRDLPWNCGGTSIEVNLGRSGRGQRIRINRTDDTYVLSSVVASADQVTVSDRYWRDLAYRAWRRNAQKDLVTFGFDPDDRLVGLIHQPAATTDDEELLLYVQALAAECDRFEYVVTGDDTY